MYEKDVPSSRAQASYIFPDGVDMRIVIKKTDLGSSVVYCLFPAIINEVLSLFATDVSNDHVTMVKSS